MREQELEGIVDPNELAAPGKVRGVDYLFLGKITNFRVKREKTKTGTGVAKVGDFLGGFDLDKEKTRITVDCGVDLRLVQPTTGSTIAASFGEYKRTDSVSALGIEVLGARAEAEAELDIDEDNQGKILRLAIDDAVRKMLPHVDRKLMQKQRAKATPGQ
jgi:curli biogenesis system outer membrane secretion channel CsgG